MILTLDDIVVYSDTWRQCVFTSPWKGKVSYFPVKFCCLDGEIPVKRANGITRIHTDDRHRVQQIEGCA